MNRISKYNEFNKDGHKVSIDLIGFKGYEFNISSENCFFTQDEVEMILEDFKIITDIHNIKLFSRDDEYDDEDYYNNDFYEICLDENPKQLIKIELFLSELIDDILNDISQFKSKVENFGFKVKIYEESRLDSVDYTYIQLKISK